MYLLAYSAKRLRYAEQKQTDLEKRGVFSKPVFGRQRWPDGSARKGKYLCSESEFQIWYLG